MKRASEVTPFLTRHLNVWCGAAQAFYSVLKWQGLADHNLKPEQFIGKPCWIGLDLSKTTDLTSYCLLFRDGDQYYAFWKTYATELLIDDPKAVLEKQVDYKETWKSYDIYSPQYDCFFEMHGHVWHDITKCKPNMASLVTSNMKNDKIKEELAKSLGKKLFVFWDDQTHLWKKQLKNVLKELQNESK